MKRGIITPLIVLAAWFGIDGNFASAQFGTLGQPPAKPRPAVSPYINQGAGGGINAFSYYGIIKPQTEANRSINELQQRINLDGSLRSPLEAGNAPNALGGLQTGHAATFFSYGNYFPMTPPMGGGSGLGGTAGFGLGGVNSGIGMSPGAGPGSRAFFAPNLNVFIR